MATIERKIKKGDAFFSTKISGRNIWHLWFFCLATGNDLKDYIISKKKIKIPDWLIVLLYFYFKKKCKFFIPGVMILSMFRTVVKKIHKEDGNFPIKKLDSFYGSNGGTKENRLYLNESKVYKIKYLCKMENRHQYIIEVCRENDDIVLQGIFSFI